MKSMARIIALGLVAGLLAIPSSAQAAKSVVVGKDVKGDFSSQLGDADPAVDAPKRQALAQIGSALGLDLVSASVGMKDKKTIAFTITLVSLPPLGAAPEIGRYIWSGTVNGKYFELDGKYTNYSRGTCDPTSGACPPPRNPGMQPFLVRGNCVTDATANLTTCQELGIVQGIFDPAKATVTIPVPMALIKAKPGSKIAPGSSSFSAEAGGNILAITSAFVSRSDFPRDAMLVTKTFRIPR